MFDHLILARGGVESFHDCCFTVWERKTYTGTIIRGSCKPSTFLALIEPGHVKGRDSLSMDSAGFKTKTKGVLLFFHSTGDGWQRIGILDSFTDKLVKDPVS